MPGKRLENISMVASFTLGSRILGLIRDILLFTFLGASGINSAFIIAFTIPNLFRRLLGEGALSSALVPTLAEELERHESAAAFQFLNRVVSRVLVGLLGLTAAGSFLLARIHLFRGLADRWYLAADLAIVLLPYVVFVCLAAIFGVALNVFNRFAIPSLSQVWLNLALILALALPGFLFADSGAELIGFLCGGVLAGGLLQLLVPAFALRREGWKFSFDFGSSQRLRELWRLFLPGVLGAAILQINFMATRLIALSLDDAAVTVLYLANRLIELPLGIFVIAITTVVFPELSRIAAKGEFKGYASVYRHGMRLILMITLPAACGLVVLGEPVLNLLFAWGAFRVEDVNRTVPLLELFALGLPFYAYAIFLTRGFHALKDTRTPVGLSVINFFLNVGLSLALIGPFGINGLALANLAAVLFHGIALRFLLGRKVVELRAGKGESGLFKVFFATLLMTVATKSAWVLTPPAFPSPKAAGLFAVVVIIPLSILLYFILLRVFRFEEAREVEGLFSGKTRF